MLNIFIHFLSALCGAVVVLYYQAGDAYMMQGHGVHPMIAGAVVLFCAGAPIALAMASRMFSSNRKL